MRYQPVVYSHGAGQFASPAGGAAVVGFRHLIEIFVGQGEAPAETRFQDSRPVDDDPLWVGLAALTVTFTGIGLGILLWALLP